MFEVTRYTPEMQCEWNAFVERSRQGTFLLDRNYMDYHHDRFADSSLVVRHKGRIYALLPANKEGDTLWSHQGLTYGGLITDKRATADGVCEVFKDINLYLQDNGFKKVIYKCIPTIYHQLPAQEDLYALTNVCNARIVVRHIASTIVMDDKIKFIESRKSGIRKAKRVGLTVGRSDNYAAFWTVLENNLRDQYGAKPVHTLSEIELLKSRFPEQIQLYLTRDAKGEVVGGTLIFETPQVIHTQYISASHEGKATGALDILFDYIINNVYSDRSRYPNIKFFDFGKSSDGDGHELNKSLIFQKEGFGGRGICYDWYSWDL